MTLNATSSAGRLEAGLLVPEGIPPLAVILCHGLPSGTPKDPGDAGYPGIARELASAGLAAAHFSFRGCYGSPGDISFPGWIDDLRAVIDAVCEKVRAPLAVAGSSLGGAVAVVEAASDDRVRAVATLAAPASLDELASSPPAFAERVRSIGLIRSPGFPADVDAWARQFAEPSPESAASKLGNRPLLVVHGSADDVVGEEHAHRLARAGSGPVTKVILDGAPHQLRHHATALRVLFAWLAAHVS